MMFVVTLETPSARYWFGPFLDWATAEEKMKSVILQECEDRGWDVRAEDLVEIDGEPFTFRVFHQPAGEEEQTIEVKVWGQNLAT